MSDTAVAMQFDPAQRPHSEPQASSAAFPVSPSVRQEVESTLRTLVAETAIDSSLVIRLARELHDTRVQNKAFVAFHGQQAAPPNDASTPPAAAQLQPDQHHFLRANMYLTHELINLRARYTQAFMQLEAMRSQLAAIQFPAPPKAQGDQISGDAQNKIKQLENELAQSRAGEYRALQHCEMLHMTNASLQHQLTLYKGGRASTPTIPAKRPQKAQAQAPSPPHTPDRDGALAQMQLLRRVQVPPHAAQWPVGSQATQSHPTLNVGGGNVRSAADGRRVAAALLQQYQQYQHSQAQARQYGDRLQQAQPQPQPQPPQQLPQSQTQPPPPQQQQQQQPHPLPQSQLQRVPLQPQLQPHSQQQASAFPSSPQLQTMQHYQQRMRALTQEYALQPQQPQELRRQAKTLLPLQQHSHQELPSHLLDHQEQLRPYLRQYLCPPQPLHIVPTEQAPVSVDMKYYSRTPLSSALTLSPSSWSRCSTLGQSASSIQSPASVPPASFRCGPSQSLNTNSPSESTVILDLRSDAGQDGRAHEASADVIDLTLDESTESVGPDLEPSKKRRRTDGHEAPQPGSASPRREEGQEEAGLEQTPGTCTQGPLSNVDAQPRDMEAQQQVAQTTQQDTESQSRDTDGSMEQRRVITPELGTQGPSSAMDIQGQDAEVEMKQQQHDIAESYGACRVEDTMEPSAPRELKASPNTSTAVSLDHPEIMELLEYSFPGAEDDASQKTCTFCRMRHEDDPGSWPILTTFNNPSRDETVGHLQKIHAEVWNAVVHGLNEEPEAE